MSQPDVGIHNRSRVPSCRAHEGAPQQRRVSLDYGSSDCCLLWSSSCPACSCLCWYVVQDKPCHALYQAVQLPPATAPSCWMSSQRVKSSTALGHLNAACGCVHKHVWDSSLYYTAAFSRKAVCRHDLCSRTADTSLTCWLPFALVASLTRSSHHQQYTESSSTYPT